MMKVMFMLMLRDIVVIFYLSKGERKDLNAEGSGAERRAGFGGFWRGKGSRSPSSGCSLFFWKPRACVNFFLV